MYYYPNIKAAREAAQQTQEQTIEKLKITKQQYSLYETGKREIPAHHLVTLAEHYNVSVDYLLGLTDEPKPLR